MLAVKYFNAVKFSIPVKSVILLFERSKEVIEFMFAAVIFPFKPSVSIPKSISFCSKFESGINVYTSTFYIITCSNILFISPVVFE